MNDLTYFLKICVITGMIIAFVGFLIVGFGYFNNSDDIIKIGVGVGMGGAGEVIIASAIGMYKESK